MKAFLVLLVALGVYPTSLSSPQEVTTKVTVYDDIFLTESGLIPLPESAVELEQEFTIESQQFYSPIKLAADQEGNIYASAKRNSSVCKFDAGGKFLLQIGKHGKGKGRLQAPYNLWVAGNSLIVHDTEKGRLEFLSFQGTYINSRNISDFTNFVCDEDDSLYVAHHVQNANSPLVRIYTADGKKTAFGKPLSFHHSMQVLNARSLALSEKGELYVAFTYFPIVRKYSARGELLAEYRIESPIMKAKENYNLKKVGESIALKTRRAGYRAVIVAIRALGDKIYLLSHVPRLEITEMDEDGNVTATYWMDSQEVYETNDFVIREINGEKKFYISHSAPPKYDINVFRKKAKKEQGGLKGEIADLTDAIAANPEYYPAYNNRGVARYRLGNYLEAIEDFSKAIELAPNSALAYNNRGLARVKIRDFDGAVKDFTTAIEWEPGNAKVLFNRGIALARKGNFFEAIKDFEKAANLDPEMAKKAREQISFCLSQWKKTAPLRSGDCVFLKTWLY
jgi:tetratricopeptide (TPR) repeat protein